MSTAIITPQELLAHWQGHRNYTRKTIVLFPEQELFGFNIGGMRSFADMVKELLTLAVPGLEGIINHTQEPYNHHLPIDTKEGLLQAWDEATPKINALFAQIADERFRESYNLFGEYNFPIVQNIQYFIDNEIHHRGQGIVYLRALGIEPPMFWDRS